MAKNKKIVRYKKPFHLNIGFVIFFIIFFYVMFYVFSYITTEHTSVYEVIQGSIALNNTYTGVAIRQEEMIPANASGDVNYYLKDGSKTGVGDMICSIDESGSISDKIDAANKDISSLKSENLASLKEQISNYVNSYDPMSFYDIYTFKDDINAEISEALSIQALNEMSKEVSEAETSFHKETAPKDGVVVYYTDGYEDTTVENFTADTFQQANYKKNNLKDKDTIEAGAPAYKLITSEAWSVIIQVDTETLNYLKDSTTVKVKFQKDKKSITAYFDTVEKDNVNYLILNFNNSMIRFCTDRFIDIELLLNEESGLKIPNTAIVKKDFYTIPVEYFQKGSDSNAEGVLLQSTDTKGETTINYVHPTIYYETDTDYFVDGEELSAGDILVKPDSQETYTIDAISQLKGVYNINKGYAVFKQIDIIYQNGEYAIIRSGTNYGIALYDHIALDGTTVRENDLVN